MGVVREHQGKKGGCKPIYYGDALENFDGCADVASFLHSGVSLGVAYLKVDSP